jgi:hypothetical protein
MTALKTTMAAVSAQVPVVQTPLEKAGLEIQSLRDQLVEMLATSMLEDSGIRDLMQELDTRRSHEPQTRMAWLNTNLDEAAQRLDDFLSSALMDAQESLMNLFDRSLAINVVSEAVERFCSEFDELEGMLDMVDAESGELDGGRSDDLPDHGGSLRELYPRTSVEVRALLS